MKNMWITTDILAPALAAQLFAVVWVYLLLVRKRMTSGYILYAVFLFSLICMLGGRALQSFMKHPWPWYINWARVAFFMAAGIPALFLASARQAGVCLKHWFWAIPFFGGSVLAVIYVFLQDARLEHGLFPAAWSACLGAPVTQLHINLVWWLSSLGMLVLPNLFFAVKEWRGQRNPTRLAFMVGAVFFGVLMTIGVFREHFGVYYVGSMVSAVIWGWAMFRHLRQMKGRAGLLKEELEWQVQSGHLNDPTLVEGQLAELEALSQGDVELYKMRVREILSSLADVAIRAGGDVSELTERTAARGRQIEQSDDPKMMRELLSGEAVELSEMVNEIQQQKETVAIQKAKQFIEQEFGRDLSVDEIAEHLGWSSSYLMREFKKQTGQTVNRHLTGIRIEKAKELLVTQNVTETAFDVGYKHANYFSTVFKKETQMTPAEFKKSLQE